MFGSKTIKDLLLGQIDKLHYIWRTDFAIQNSLNKNLI